MTLNLPAVGNRDKAADHIAEGRQLSDDAGGWLDDIDALLEPPVCDLYDSEGCYFDRTTL